ncbi:hypothetical protein BH10BAC2_BH10BAC2_30980 [soil metagenome]
MKFLLIPVTCFLVQSASAQYGTLDTSFGEQGVIIENRFTGYYNDMAYQPDGKIILAGNSFVLSRYNSDGSPDFSFGDNGIVNYISSTNCYALAIQEDGKIIAVGDTSFYGNPYGSNIFLVRYKTNGEIDSSFGKKGKVYTNIERYDRPTRIAIRPDGKIIVSGKALNDPGEEPDRIYAICYNNDGSLDETFGTKGVFSLYNEYGLFEANGLAVDADGNSYIGFNVSVGQLDYNIIKLDKYGNKDENYGTQGVATYTFPNLKGGVLSDMILQADGKILTAGTAEEVMISRFTTNGQLDESFGTGGYSILNLQNNNSEGNSLVINNEDKIIVAGRITAPFPSFDYNLALFGFDINGHLDSSFGNNGYEVTSLSQRRGIYRNIIINSDGNIIASGSSYSLETNATNFLLAQYLGDKDYVKHPKFVKIKKWLHHHGFTWENFPAKHINYYAVQRSSNGSAFNEVAKLFNRGNQQQYSYEDANALAGNNYYRVAAVSVDGNISYSNIIAIENTGGSVKIYPNPVKNSLQIEGLSATQKTKLSITDFTGNTRMNTAVTGSSYNWNISQLKQGNYILKIESNNIIVTKKFIKE